MFDKHTYNSKTKVCPVTQVVEKSITPDRVTDMYDDVREEVEKSILRKIVVNDNSFNGAMIETYSPEIGARKISIRFTLNGKEYLKDKIVTDEASFVSDHEFTNFFIDLISDVVIGELLKNEAPKLKIIQDRLRK